MMISTKCLLNKYVLIYSKGADEFQWGNMFCFVSFSISGAGVIGYPCGKNES